MTKEKYQTNPREIGISSTEPVFEKAGGPMYLQAHEVRSEFTNFVRPQEV